MAKKTQPRYRKFIGFLYIGISAILIYTLAINAIRVVHQRSQLIQLQEKKAELEKEKEALAKEVELLNDDDYVARYARDNWIFSEDGEEVIKLPDSKK